MVTNSHADAARTLTPKQEKFCQLYAADVRFFGNATRAYIEAYNVDLNRFGAYRMANAAASQNLVKPHVMKRINQLLKDIGFDDTSVDKQLAFLIMQHTDLRAKAAGIKEYNALKQRITRKIEINDLRETRDKIKDFLDEPADHTASEPNASGTEPAGPAAGSSTNQVA